MKLPLSPALQIQATELLKQYQDNALVDLEPLRTLSQGQRISAYTLAVAKAQKQPYLSFLLAYRPELTSQLFIDNRICSAATFIVFRGIDGQDYILLNANRGVLSDISAQWTGVHVRVEQNESELADEKTNAFCKNATKYSTDLTPFALAAARAGAEFGLDPNQFPIKQILPIKRGQYGLTEASVDKYRTEHMCVVLENCDPLKLIASLRENAFGDKIHCISVYDYLTNTKNQNNQFIYSCNGVTLPVRDSLWRFSRNLFQLNVLDMRAHNDSDKIEDRKCNPGTEFATFQVFRADIPQDLDFSLMLHPKNNRLPANKVYEIGKKFNLNPEDVAANSLNKERILLREIIAQIHFFTLVDGNLDSMAWDVYNALSATAIDESLLITEEMQKEKYVLLEKMQSNKQHYHAGQYYHLTESDETIAENLVLDKYRVAKLQVAYSGLVKKIIQDKIQSQQFKALQHYPLQKRINCAIIGPVASGKSSSVKQVKQDFPDMSFNLLGSDEFINLLLANQDTSNIETHRGWLMLSEAWYIKKRFLELLHEGVTSNKAPCILFETLNIRNVPVDLAVVDNGEFHVYVNTANPEGSIERMEARGKKEHRYVDPQTTVSSYQTVSLHFNSMVSYLMKDYVEKNIRLVLRDTDALFYQGPDPKPEPRLLAITFNGKPALTIYNYEGLIKFFERANKTVEIGKSSATWEMTKTDENQPKQSLATLVRLFSTVKIKLEDFASNDFLTEVKVTPEYF